ncbi:MAG: AAA family ATPase [Spirochaetaceae bacterium]|nr:AAA family ATPase [Spirochaetaceae bacterium]
MARLLAVAVSLVLVVDDAPAEAPSASVPVGLSVVAKGPPVPMDATGRLGATSPVAAPAPVEASSQAAAPTPSVPAPAPLDPALVDLERELEALLRGELPETRPVAALFGVPIDDRARVAARVAELETLVAAQEDRLAAMRARLAELARAELEDPRPEQEPTPEAPATGSPVGDGGVAPIAPPAEATGSEGTRAAVAAESAGGAGSDGPAEAGQVETLAEDPEAATAPLRAAAEARAARKAAEAERRAREVAERSARHALATEAWQTRYAARRQERAELEAQRAAAELGLSVASKRLDYLERLLRQLERMSDASRRILPTLAEPRNALRAHSAELSGLVGALDGVAARVGVVSRRAASGMIVGFVSDQRAVAEELDTAAAAYTSQARRLERLAGVLTTLAAGFESEGRQVRAAFFRSVVRSDGQASLDALFLEHLKHQRRLRKTIGEAAHEYGRDRVEAVRQEAESLVPRAVEIGTTGDARDLVDQAIEHRLRVETLIAAETSAATGWELAFENELVTVLSEQASAGVRSSAYGFSRELVDDVTSEIALAWARARAGVEARLEDSPGLLAFAVSPGGQPLLLRFVGVLVVFASWLVVRRKAPRLTVLTVRGLARLEPLRARLGLLVRLSGLVQALLPVVVGVLALWIVLRIVGGDTPIGEALEAVFVPVLVYSFGARALVGATRRITPGRPALIQIAPATLERLRRTYATLGVVIVVASVVDGLARVAVGAGRVVSLVDGVVFFWVGIWAIVEAWRWRVHLAGAWRALTPETDPPGPERRVAGWMAVSRLGFLLSPVALLRLVGTPLAGFASARASETDLFQRLRAHLLRRRSERAEPVSRGARRPIPDEYREAFPLYPVLGEDDALIVPRKDVVEEATSQWSRWRSSRLEGSLVLVGEKGAGKTTLAGLLARRFADDTDVVRHTIRGKPVTRSALVAELARALDLPHVDDPADLAERLCEGEERVVLLDECHNVFLRQIDGYGGYDALVEIVNATSSHVFWVLVFNSFTWRFLNESRGRMHYFRKLLPIPRWSPEEIQKLIRLRHDRTGFDLRFDEVLLSRSHTDTEGLELVEEAEGYFRLLWESSGGNPRIATQLWLDSLRPISAKTLGVGLFPEPDAEVLSSLAEDLVFALAAICQHENLSDAELARVLNLSEGFASFATQYLLESGFIEAKDETGERFTLSPAYYRSVLRALRNKHLLFE